MMRLTFDRSQKLLVAVIDSESFVTWPASNNASRASRGPWPAGTYRPKQLVRVGGPEGEPAGAFGPWFLLYDVPDRKGMGIHAGRDGRADLAGRLDWEYATLGCIRTTTAAIEELARLVNEHGLPELQILEGGMV